MESAISQANFNEAATQYEQALIEQSKAYEEVIQAKQVMESTGLNIEVHLISEHGNDPKKIGSTESDRKRAYEYAKDQSSAYKAAKEHYASARSGEIYTKGIVDLMRMKMQFLIALSRKD